jgi:hypothetical protein
MIPIRMARKFTLQTLPVSVGLTPQQVRDSGRDGLTADEISTILACNQHETAMLQDSSYDKLACPMFAKCPEAEKKWCAGMEPIANAFNELMTIEDEAPASASAITSDRKSAASKHAAQGASFSAITTVKKERATTAAAPAGASKSLTGTASSKAKTRPSAPSSASASAMVVTSKGRGRKSTREESTAQEGVPAAKRPTKAPVARAPAAVAMEEEEEDRDYGMPALMYQINNSGPSITDNDGFMRRRGSVSKPAKMEKIILPTLEEEDAWGGEAVPYTPAVPSQSKPQRPTAKPKAKAIPSAAKAGRGAAKAKPASGPGSGRGGRRYKVGSPAWLAAKAEKEAADETSASGYFPAPADDEPEDVDDDEEFMPKARAAKPRAAKPRAPIKAKAADVIVVEDSEEDEEMAKEESINEFLDEEAEEDEAMDAADSEPEYEDSEKEEE